MVAPKAAWPVYYINSPGDEYRRASLPGRMCEYRSDPGIIQRLLFCSYPTFLCVLFSYRFILIISIRKAKKHGFLKRTRRNLKWHFQIFTDGTTKLKMLLQLPAERPAALQTSRKKNPQHADQPAARQHRKKSRLPAADQPAAHLINNQSFFWRLSKNDFADVCDLKLPLRSALTRRHWRLASHFTLIFRLIFGNRTQGKFVFRQP